MKTGQGLQLLHRVSLALVREAKPDGLADLSMRQLSILMIVYLEPPPHTVRGLAAKLGVTKPVITRALDSMGKAGLVSRKRDEADKRNVVIQRTVKGALYIEQIGDMVAAKANGELAGIAQ
ncbi:MAG: MarR family transcriptional regulator [Alphaproteobacteria bacterium]|nr:MarR family transcriptional regulator [Alphaproteobacteria bacterium]